MELPDAIHGDRFKALLKLARDEDWGAHGDITTALLADNMRDMTGRWAVVARQAGRFCGVKLIAPILGELAPEVRVEHYARTEEMMSVAAGESIVTLRGNLMQMLAAERTLLNFLQRMSGVATRTAEFVAAVAGTHAKIFDTRKTLPGWRDLDKYAVRCGGGHNHRWGLHDAVLIKDNHIAGVPLNRLAHFIFDMLNRIERESLKPKFVEVEVDGLEQLDEVFKVVGVDVVLLDNFSAETARRAVNRRDELGLRGRIELEISGGVTLANVAQYASTGVERIAIGAVTHSAMALDIGLDSVS